MVFIVHYPANSLYIQANMLYVQALISGWTKSPSVEQSSWLFQPRWYTIGRKIIWRYIPIHMEGDPVTEQSILSEFSRLALDSNGL